jgi:hypothetical protein
MSEKKVSAIQAVTLNTATFENEPFTPTYINFFYGKNGAGKHPWAAAWRRELAFSGRCEVPANYEICLYILDFIDQLFDARRLRGVFSLSDGRNEEVENV